MFTKSSCSIVILAIPPALTLYTQLMHAQTQKHLHARWDQGREQTRAWDKKKKKFFSFQSILQRIFVAIQCWTAAKENMARNENEMRIIAYKICLFLCFKFIYRFIFVCIWNACVIRVVDFKFTRYAKDFCCWFCYFYRPSQLFALDSSCVCLPVDRDGIRNGLHDTAAINNSHLAFIIWNFLFTLQLVEMYKSNDGKCEGLYDKQKSLDETMARERAGEWKVEGGESNVQFFFSFVLSSTEGFTFRSTSFTLNNNFFAQKMLHSWTDLSNKI